MCTPSNQSKYSLTALLSSTPHNSIYSSISSHGVYTQHIVLIRVTSCRAVFSDTLINRQVGLQNVETPARLYRSCSHSTAEDKEERDEIAIFYSLTLSFKTETAASAEEAADAPCISRTHPSRTMSFFLRVYSSPSLVTYSGKAWWMASKVTRHFGPRI